ncbi:diuretic hormone class 2 [Coccinella septempunctata]|uniref:diuretic hormone class 2 n=1 Tax=Coccinella septempunctata TaxID=41139 RepID=UPI001D093316|nr:diuretic hormone class 2 [Coccinella septempunctata]
MDFTVPADENLAKAYSEKVSKYSELAFQLRERSPEEDLITRDDPEYIIRVFRQFRTYYNNIPDDEDDSWTDSKRGLDLGLGRGYSGSLAAKQRMGLASANFAGGPGRRRRNGLEV